MSEINVLSNYEINNETMALIPAHHIEYDTLVLEPNRKLYIKKRPLEIIKAACLEGGSTYDGRRQAVIHQTGAQHKVPIPIDPVGQIYAFPTQSPDQYECHWIFYHHVRSIKPNSKVCGESIITFKKSSNPLLLKVSHPTLQKQLQRTSFCIVRFSHLAFTNHVLTEWEPHF